MSFRLNSADFHQVLPLAPQPDTVTTVTPGRPVFYTCPLLEHNRIPMHPWMTVALAEEEVKILEYREQEIFRDEQA